MNTKELNQRAVEVATKYLERKGYKIVDRPELDRISIVASDPISQPQVKNLIFVVVLVREMGSNFAETKATRSDLEKEACVWLSSNPPKEDETAIRFDEISIVHTSEEKALLRHHSNILE